MKTPRRKISYEYFRKKEVVVTITHEASPPLVDIGDIERACKDHIENLRTWHKLRADDKP